jgi:hypothetical protein
VAIGNDKTKRTDLDCNRGTLLPPGCCIYQLHTIHHTGKYSNRPGRSDPRGMVRYIQSPGTHRCHTGRPGTFQCNQGRLMPLARTFHSGKPRRNFKRNNIKTTVNNKSQSKPHLSDPDGLSPNRPAKHLAQNAPVPPTLYQPGRQASHACSTANTQVSRNRRIQYLHTYHTPWL